MKITGLEIFKVKPRWIFLKISTDEGIVGWGELISGTKTNAVTACCKEIGERIIGRNPFEIERLWQELYRYFYRGGQIHMTAVSAIEMALWDIKGKYYNAPVYELLGGAARDSIMVYSWIGGDRPEDTAKDAKERLNKGFQAVKMNACEEMHYIDSFQKVESAVQRLAEIREAVGYELEVGIDFHGRVHKPMAKVLAKELEPYRPMFLEEVVLSENIEGLKEVARYTNIPLATGERLFTRWEFKNLLKEGIVDIIQPDLALTGGILEGRKIAAMAEAFDIAVAPHAPYGPVALAATFQMDAVTPNVFIQEQSLGIHYNRGFDLLDFVQNKEIFEFKNGFVDLPSKPGLGIEIDEEKLRANQVEELNWTNPKWKNYDGTIAEW